MTAEETMILIAERHGMKKLVTGHSTQLFKEAMIEFAKFHREEMIKTILIKGIDSITEHYSHSNLDEPGTTSLDIDKLYSVYPENLIK